MMYNLWTFTRPDGIIHYPSYIIHEKCCRDVACCVSPPPHKGNLCRERFALKIVLEDKVVLVQHVKEHFRNPDQES